MTNVIVYDLPGAPAQTYFVPDAWIAQLTITQGMTLQAALNLIAGQALPAGATNLTFTTDDQLPTLWMAQNQQAALLRAAAQAQIVGGWRSAALGSPHAYPSDVLEQINMMASCIDAQRVPPAWQPSTAYALDDSVMAGSVRLLCTAAGTSGTVQPTGPGSDGTVAWAAWSTPFFCADQSGNQGFVEHSAAQILQAGADGKAMIKAARRKLAALIAQVFAAQSIAAVRAITW